MECPHERMPGDPCPSPDGRWPREDPCGCFPVELAVVIRLPERKEPPPVKHHVFPEHVRRRAVALYQEGCSLEEAAGRVGACRNSVRAWVVEAGVEVRGRWAA